MESFCFGDVNGGPAFRGPDARPPELLLALHGHIETFSKVPQRLYRLFDAPFLPRPPPKGVFDLAGSIVLSLEFVRVKGLEDSTSECVVFCLRQGVATAAPFLSRDHSPIGDVTVLVTFASGGQGHALFVGAVACDLLWREGWDLMSKFQGAGREVFIVLIVVVQGTVLSMDGGSRLKGVNSLKSSEDLWGPVRWHSRLYPFLYSEPLTNLASYFGARGISDEKAINKHASKQTKSSPNPLAIPSGVAKLCAPEFHLVGACMRRAYATRLGRVHLPGDARRTRVRRSHHLLFTTPNEDARHRIYNREIETPKVDGLGRTNETRARTGRPFSSIDRGVSDSLMPRISVNHGMTIMPLSGRTNDSEAKKETILNTGGVKEHSAIFQRTRPRGLLDPP
ncbi:hypothetical protein CRG98_006757 [Punica granatum]|uniref:Uncharacterized protein n=1 Tax=Punica granatum TaxID=22663 RepID=A0A2I0KWQ7_PUNGR|nr:hypothetical protein CRG98_006757 [Punica granatum]